MVTVLERTPREPFDAKLMTTNVLNVNEEQWDYIKDILNVSCSDSRFAQKAFIAIMRVLTGESMSSPVVVSLSPSTVVLGSPSFDVHVIGTGFNPDSVIVFNGHDEPTTFVSATDLSTGVNMPLWQAPAVVPIAVRNPSGTLSNSENFTFTEVIALGAAFGRGAASKIIESKKAEEVLGPKIDNKLPEPEKKEEKK